MFDLPSPKTSSFSRLPIATCARRGSRLYGTPSGFSPMTPLGCAPAGLKYLSNAAFHLSPSVSPLFLAIIR